MGLLQIKRGAIKPVLGEGELFLNTDSNVLYVGLGGGEEIKLFGDSNKIQTDDIVDKAVTLGKVDSVSLEEQTETDTSKTELTHDISSYSFSSAPFVLVSVKSEYGVYIKTVTSTLITLGVNSLGVGTIKYDLLIIAR